MVLDAATWWWLLGVFCAFVFYKCFSFFWYFYEVATKPVGQPPYARKRDSQTINAQQPPKVIIVGAGPGGIAVAGALNHLGIANLVIERNDKIASSWRGHYKRLHLHTVNQFSSLPHVPFPPHYPLFVPREMFADYITGYASMMQVKVNFNENVNSVSRAPGGSKWIVETLQNGKQKNKKTSILFYGRNKYEAENVVLCPGENIVPLIPAFKDQNLFKGTVVHSSQYHTAETYRGKKVLVVGFGNTGGELSIDLYEHGCDVHILARSPVNIAKRQTLILAPKIARYLPSLLQMALEWVIIRLEYGDMHKYGIKCPISSDFKDSIYNRLRIHHEAPVVDIGQIDLIRKGNIKVHSSEIERFTPTGVVFKNGKEETFDAVVLATGFKPNLAQILDGPIYKSVVNELGFPKARQDISQPGLFFVGFADEAGRILKMTEDSIAIAATIKAR